MTAPTHRLVTEALAKSGLIWVSSDAGTAPVWYAHLDGVAYFVSGEGEQFSPDHAGDVSIVTRSKETRARLISFDGEATRLKPDDDDWEAATQALKAGRLNARGEDSIERWREHNPITRITPNLATVVLRGKLLDAPAEAPDDAETDDNKKSADKSDAAQGTTGEDEKSTGKTLDRPARAQRPAATKPSTAIGDTTGADADVNGDKTTGATSSTSDTSADASPSQTSAERAKPQTPPKLPATNDDSKADDA